MPFTETQRRAAIRDAELFGSEAAVLDRYAVRYVPGQRLYFRQAHPQASANVVVDNEDPDHPSLQLNVSTV